jgi:hypothetical protein
MIGSLEAHSIIASKRTLEDGVWAHVNVLGANSDVLGYATIGLPAVRRSRARRRSTVPLRWPERLRGSGQAILDIPVAIANNTATPGTVPRAERSAQPGPGATAANP